MSRRNQPDGQPPEPYPTLVDHARTTSGTVDFGTLTAALSEVVMDDYRDSRVAPLVHEFIHGPAVYLHAESGAHEARTVLAIGRPQPPTTDRDATYQRGYPASESWAGRPVDRGHASGDRAASTVTARAANPISLRGWEIGSTSMKTTPAWTCGWWRSTSWRCWHSSSPSTMRAHGWPLWDRRRAALWRWPRAWRSSSSIGAICDSFRNYRYGRYSFKFPMPRPSSPTTPTQPRAWYCNELRKVRP